MAKEYILLLVVILCMSWYVGQPYIAKRERKKRNEAWKKSNEKAKNITCQ